MSRLKNRWSGPGPWFLGRPARVGLAGLLLLLPVASPGQGILNQLLPFGRPAQPGVPGLPGPLGNALGGGGGGAASAVDLIGLLSQATENIDEPKEIEIGRQLAAVLLGSKPLHPDMALQRYVNQLGRWISLRSTRPDLPWTFAVLNDPGYNAFAAPGGYVFVTKGLIDRTSDEAELAGILAHEITHVEQRHHLKALRKTARAGVATQLIGSQLSREVGSALSSQLISMGRNLYSKGLDQEDEFEADRAGVVLAARAGFDPYGLVAALHQLRMVTPDNPAFTLTISTHPAAQVRLDQVELAMGHRLDSLSGKPALTLPQRLEQLAAAGPSQSAAASPAPAGTARPGTAAPAALAAATKPQALAKVNANGFAAGDVLLPKVAGVKAYRDANESRELMTLARTDEVVFDGAENGGFMKVETPKGSGWVKAIMLRKP